MISFLFITLATALSLLIVDLVVPGVNLANFPAAIIAAIALGIVNSSVKPTLSLLSLPLNIISLGFASLLVNGLCFWLAAILVPGFGVRGLIAFLLGPVILSFVNTFLNNYFVERNPQIKADM